jgi:transposase
LIEERGCKLLYLPPYSPDLNPIEEAFSKIKGFLRKAGARTREALVEALSASLKAVTARDTRGFFEHCGYRIPEQQLLRIAVGSSIVALPQTPSPSIPS